MKHFDKDGEPAVETGPIRRAGARILLREHQLSDTGPLEEIWGDSAVMRYMVGGAMSQQQITDTLQQTLEAATHQLRHFYRLAVVRKDDDAVVGSLAMELERYSSAYAHGLTMHPRASQSAFALEAIDLLMGIAFEGLGLHRVWCITHVKNTTAKRLMLLAGFAPQGRFHEFALSNGHWCDFDAFALVEHQWRSRPRDLTPRQAIAAARRART